MTITVMPYDESWPMQFAELERRYRIALADVALLAIEHVGSTAVPGLVAKPIIDIDIVVTREYVAAAADALERIGYVALGELGIPDRWAFKAPAGSAATNTYITVEGCLSLRNHLGVRDVLRRDAVLRAHYAEVKLQLASRVDDIETYIAGKSAVLQTILERAGINADERRRIDGINRDVRIREYRDGDAPALWRVFHSSVHQLARSEYDDVQRNAWAPETFDATEWAELIARLRPFVVEDDSEIVAYADLQPDGYIDHFFVAGNAGKRGIGTRLLTHLLAAARARGIHTQYAHVSLTAQSLFSHFGFIIETNRTVRTRGVAMRNALIRRMGAAN